MKAQQSQGAEFQQSVAAARPESAQEAVVLIMRCCLKLQEYDILTD